MAFDPAIADQLTQLTLAGAGNDQALNNAAARNMNTNSNTVLTLGVQLTHMAALNQETSIDPMEAAAAANIRSSQDPSHFAGLNTAAQTPKA